MQNELQINELTSLGFGAYHTGLSDPDHALALNFAIEQGCNLIDTSSNYEDGDSEKLIGEVIKEIGDNKVFIVSKVGYIQGGNLDLLAKLNEEGKAKKDLLELSENLKHSIHPEFLQSQLDQSLQRLGVDRLDAWLLHNPEYYFRLHEDPEDYYRRIREAFVFMEKQVMAGKIRYYGISSNTFPLPEGDPQQTNLKRIHSIAQEINPEHHFRFVQFPFNITEKGALQSVHCEGKSLIELAKEFGLQTMVNRPLNARNGDEFLRLASYPEVVAMLDEARDIQHWNKLKDLVQQRFDEMGLEEEVLSVEVMAHLEENWMRMGNNLSIRHVLVDYLLPFLTYIYQESIPDEVYATVRRLNEVMDLYTRKVMTEKVLPYEKVWEEKGILIPGDHRPLSVKAVDYYLRSGFDHVLMGMRRKKYVEEMQPLFKA